MSRGLGGVGGPRVGVEFFARRLETLQRTLGALGLAHHRGGLVAHCAAIGVGCLVEVGQALAMLPVFRGGDELGGVFGLDRVGRPEARMRR